MKLGNPKKNQKGLKLNGTHQILVYADDDNVMGDNENTVNIFIEALSVIGNDVTVLITVTMKLLKITVLN